MLARIFWLLTFAVSAFVISSSAKADWYEASSDHFVIYADNSERDIRRYAENLERYHSAMEHFTGRDLPTPSPSNRLTIYALGSSEAVRQLAGSSGIAAFYIPSAQGSVAFIQNTSHKSGTPDISTISLLHEYAHHFLSMTDRFAMPLWMNEGAAEFFASAYFRDDGAVFLGLPRSHHDFTIFWREQDMTPVRELLALDWSQLNGRSAKAKASFYGRSWLLYHYLSMTEERSGQLREYWIEVLQGTPSLDAARKVFGDIGVLERQLNQHYRDRTRTGYEVSADKISASSVALRALSDGESAMMDIRVRLERGLDQPKAIELAEELRKIASDYSDDAIVQTVLAEIELKAGYYNAAIDAATVALSIDPDQTDAYVAKGLAGFRLARTATDQARKAAAYEQAMKPLLMLKSKQPDHTVPLLYSYRYFAEQGIVPTEASKRALIRAAELAPFDRELWLIVGMIHMNDGRITDARAALQPLSSNPHGWTKADQVRDLLTFLADKQNGQGIPVQSAISAYFIEG